MTARNTTEPGRTTRKQSFRIVRLGVVAGCAALAASAQAPPQVLDYRRDFTGAWSLEGRCEFADYVFAERFIERGGEDICEVERGDNLPESVVVTAACWHEFRSVGATTYELRLNAAGRLIIGGATRHEYHRCGPVPARLNEAYLGIRPPLPGGQ